MVPVYFALLVLGMFAEAGRFKALPRPPPPAQVDGQAVACGGGMVRPVIYARPSKQTFALGERACAALRPQLTPVGRPA